MTTALVRNGTAIQRLFDNPNYDFNYQFAIDIEPTKLYKVCWLLSLFIKRERMRKIKNFQTSLKHPP